MRFCDKCCNMEHSHNMHYTASKDLLSNPIKILLANMAWHVHCVYDKIPNNFSFGLCKVYAHILFYDREIVLIYMLSVDKVFSIFQFSFKRYSRYCCFHCRCFSVYMLYRCRKSRAFSVLRYILSFVVIGISSSGYFTNTFSPKCDHLLRSTFYVIVKIMKL